MVSHVTLSCTNQPTDRRTNEPTNRCGAVVLDSFYLSDSIHASNLARLVNRNRPISASTATSVHSTSTSISISITVAWLEVVTTANQHSQLVTDVGQMMSFADTTLLPAHVYVTVEREREICIRRIKQAAKRDMPIKPGAYC